MVRLPPDALELLILDGAEQLGLKFERHFADLVEKQCPLIRQFEASDLLRTAPVKDPLLVPEELAFEQAAGNGRAVHFDEAALAAAAHLVNRAGHEFFSGAGFAENQNSGIGGRDDLNSFQNGLKGCPLPTILPLL